MSVAKFKSNDGPVPEETAPEALPSFDVRPEARKGIEPGFDLNEKTMDTALERVIDDRDEGVELDRELLEAIGKMIPARKRMDPVTSEEKSQAAIRTIMMRLSDVLFLSNDMVAPQEKALADDLIARLFERATRATQLKLVERMLHHSEPPPALVRTMLHSEDEIALPLIRSPLRLKQADLISVVMTSGSVYQRAVAEREGLQSAVCDTIIQCADVATIRVMLRNRTAVISRTGFIRLAEKSIKDHDILGPLIERLDFPADMAHLVFWWSPSDLRRQIIERFASSRQTVFEVIPQDIANEIDDLLPEVANALRMVRKAQKVDRDQIDWALTSSMEGMPILPLMLLPKERIFEPRRLPRFSMIAAAKLSAYSARQPDLVAPVSYGFVRYWQSVEMKIGMKVMRAVMM